MKEKHKIRRTPLVEHQKDMGDVSKPAQGDKSPLRLVGDVALLTDAQKKMIKEGRIAGLAREIELLQIRMLHAKHTMCSMPDCPQRFVSKIDSEPVDGPPGTVAAAPDDGCAAEEVSIRRGRDATDGR